MSVRTSHGFLALISANDVSKTARARAIGALGDPVSVMLCVDPAHFRSRNRSANVRMVGLDSLDVFPWPRGWSTAFIVTMDSKEMDSTSGAILGELQTGRKSVTLEYRAASTATKKRAEAP